MFVHLKNLGGLSRCEMKYDQILNQRTNIEKCPVCASRNKEFWRELKGWPLVRCLDCGMRFVNPVPTEECLAVAYGLPKKEYDEFFQSEYINTEYILGGESAKYKVRAAEFLDRIESKLGRVGRVLEIGCGGGDFLDEAKQRGWRTAGVDPGDWQCDSQKDIDLGIQRKPLFESDFQKESFDVIFMSSLLEHLAEPNKYIALFYQLLKPGGLLFVAGLPNINSITILLGFDKWIGNHPPLHLLYFSRKTAHLFLEKHGYSSITVTSSGISETVLNFFITQGEGYTGDYNSELSQNYFKRKTYGLLKRPLNQIFNLTGTGSVLEVFGFKN